MKPRVRSDVYFVPTDEGAFLVSGDASMSLQGTTIYSWLERLLPLFDGTRDLDRMLGRLDPARAAMIRDIVEALVSRGFLVDTTGERGSELSQAEFELYRDEIAFIGVARDSPAARFGDWRRTDVLVVGVPRAINHIVRSLHDLGCMQVAVAATSGEGSKARAEEFASARTRDPMLSLTEISPSEAIGRARSAGLVFVAASDATLIDQIVTAAPHALVIALVGDAAWVSARPADGDAATWPSLCAALVESGEFDGVISEWFTGPAASMPGNLAVYSAFRSITGAPPAPVTSVVERVDLATLVVQPIAITARGRRREIGDEPLSAADLSKRAAALVDPILGPILSLTEPGSQTPRRLSVASVRTRGRTGTVVGTGETLSAARAEAVVRSCARLAAASIERTSLARRVWGGSDTTAPELTPIDQPRAAGVAASQDPEAAIAAAVLDLADEWVIENWRSLTFCAADPVSSDLMAAHATSIQATRLILALTDAPFPIAALVQGDIVLDAAAGLSRSDAVERLIERWRLTSQLPAEFTIDAAQMPSGTPIRRLGEGGVAARERELSARELASIIGEPRRQVEVVWLDHNDLASSVTPHIVQAFFTAVPDA